MVAANAAADARRVMVKIGIFDMSGDSSAWLTSNLLAALLLMASLNNLLVYVD